MGGPNDKKHESILLYCGNLPEDEQKKLVRKTLLYQPPTGDMPEPVNKSYRLDVNWARWDMHVKVIKVEIEELEKQLVILERKLLPQIQSAESLLDYYLE